MEGLVFKKGKKLGSLKEPIKCEQSKCDPESYQLTDKNFQKAHIKKKDFHEFLELPQPKEEPKPKKKPSYEKPSSKSE